MPPSRTFSYDCPAATRYPTLCYDRHSVFKSSGVLHFRSTVMVLSGLTVASNDRHRKMYAKKTHLLLTVIVKVRKNILLRCVMTTTGPSNCPIRDLPYDHS